MEDMVTNCRTLDERKKRNNEKISKKGTMMKKIILMPMDSEETWQENQIEKETSPIKKIQW